MFPALFTLKTSRTLTLSLGLTFAAVFLLISTVRASTPAQGTTCPLAPINTDPTASVCISGVVVPFNGVSPQNQFFVSWRSSGAVQGQVKLETGEVFDDVRGADYKGITHYVAVSNLDAKTTYDFDVISGGQVYTNNGAHWSVRMGPALQTSNPYAIVGRVKNPDGSDADGTVVFAQIRDGDDKGTQGRAAYLSALIVLADGGNYFTIDLDRARTQNQSQQYVFDPGTDRVQIIAVGAQGTVVKTFSINELHPPAPAPSLTLSGSGAGTAATATPTPIPPTGTPTFTVTLTPTATLSLTATATPFIPTETPFLSEATDVPTAQASTPTLAADQPTATPETPTLVAIPAGEEVEKERTRVFGGVPDVLPPPAAPDNTALFIALALVLFIGALLLGAAAFFILKR